jgi:predicted DCC family thiol-disulfide oxidoreductase YuxK
MNKLEKNYNLVLFDGVCNLCEASVEFIINHDSKNYFHFTSQTSAIGKVLWETYKLEEIDSIIFIKNGKAYTHSDAALEICKNLDGWYKYLYIFHFIPKALRDVLYKLVAKYRYKVFGKKDSCMMPSIELKDRFLE